MSKINSRAKGANGEREFCKWLYENFNIQMPQRNLEQVRSGGTDIIDFEPFFIEVKRREILDLDSWWVQVVSACRKDSGNPIPVVAFRRNRKPWEFLISAQNIGCEKSFIRVSGRIFIEWALKILQTHEQE